MDKKQIDKQISWEKEFNKLPQSKMTTKDFIRQLLSRKEKEILEELLEKIKEKYPVYSTYENELAEFRKIIERKLKELK